MPPASVNDVAVVRRYLDAFSRHDLATTTDAVHPKATLVPLPRYSGIPAASYHGREGARGLAEAIFARMPELRVEPQAFRSVGDRLLVKISVIESPDMQESSEVTDLHRVADGRIVRAEAFTSEAAAEEAAGRPTEDEFEILFRQAPVPIVMLDDDGYFVDANAAACVLYGLDAAGLRGRSILDFVPSDSVRQVEQFLRASRSKKELTGEFGLVTHAGEHHPAVQVRTCTGIARGRQAAILLAHAQQARRDRTSRLTPRERDVFRMLAAGMNAPEAGDRLGISRDTVRTHVRNATVKLEARNRVQAVALALALGEIELGPESA